MLIVPPLGPAVVLSVAHVPVPEFTNGSIVPSSKPSEKVIVAVAVAATCKKV